MAIAKVRIAPIEYWCAFQKQELQSLGIQPEQVCGREVQIETAPIYEDSHCHGKMWAVVQDSTNRIRATLNKAPDEIKSYLCEHQLEMD